MTTFAGFEYPKLLWSLPSEPLKERLRYRALCKGCTGPYYSPEPAPNDKGPVLFYLNELGQPFTRWRWATKLGWPYSDYSDYSDTIRGIVIRLPHGRFLAGCSMGEGMASWVFRDIHDDFGDARKMADEHARVMAHQQYTYAQAADEEEEEDEEEY